MLVHQRKDCGYVELLQIYMMQSVQWSYLFSECWNKELQIIFSNQLLLKFSINIKFLQISITLPPATSWIWFSEFSIYFAGCSGPARKIYGEFSKSYLWIDCYYEILCGEFLSFFLLYFLFSLCRLDVLFLYTLFYALQNTIIVTGCFPFLISNNTR